MYGYRWIYCQGGKTIIGDFCLALSLLGVQICSTGGSFKSFQDSGVSAASISTITGFLEIMDGRLKTPNPKIHRALLALREDVDHVKLATKNGIIRVECKG